MASRIVNRRSGQARSVPRGGGEGAPTGVRCVSCGGGCPSDGPWARAVRTRGPRAQWRENRPATLHPREVAGGKCAKMRTGYRRAFQRADGAEGGPARRGRLSRAWPFRGPSGARRDGAQWRGAVWGVTRGTPNSRTTRHGGRELGPRAMKSARRCDDDGSCSRTAGGPASRVLLLPGWTLLAGAWSSRQARSRACALQPRSHARARSLAPARQQSSWLVGRPERGEARRSREARSLYGRAPALGRLSSAASDRASVGRGLGRCQPWRMAMAARCGSGRQPHGCSRHAAVACTRSGSGAPGKTAPAPRASAALAAADSLARPRLLTRRRSRFRSAACGDSQSIANHSSASSEPPAEGRCNSVAVANPRSSAAQSTVLRAGFACLRPAKPSSPGYTPHASPTWSDCSIHKQPYGRPLSPSGSSHLVNSSHLAMSWPVPRAAGRAPTPRPHRTKTWRPGRNGPCSGIDARLGAHIQSLAAAARTTTKAAEACTAAFFRAFSLPARTHPRQQQRQARGARRPYQ
eukprot:scaffold2549_cov343-Prasinococcus_capsulatus_cf.AAC.1